jgi:hypothetical protein
MRKTALPWIALAMIASVGADEPKPAPKAAAPTRLVRDLRWTPKPGDLATIVVGEGKRVFLATSEADWSPVYMAVQARDEIGIRELVRDGRAMVVLDPTEVLIIAKVSGFYALEVRLREGPNRGKAGIVAVNHVARLVEVKAKRKGR